MAKKEYKSFKDMPKQQAYISPDTKPKKSKVNWHDKYVEWKDKAIAREDEIKKLKEYNQLSINRACHQKNLEIDELDQKIRILIQKLANRDTIDKLLTYYLKRSKVFNRAEVQYPEDTWFPNMDPVPHVKNSRDDSDSKDDLVKLYLERGIDAEDEAISLFENAGIIKWSDQPPSNRKSWAMDSTRPQIDRGAMDVWFPSLPNGQQNVAVDIKHYRTKPLWGLNYSSGTPRAHGHTINYGKLERYIDYLDHYNIAVGYLWWIKPLEYLYWGDISRYAEYLIDVRQVSRDVKTRKLDLLPVPASVKQKYENPYYVEIPFSYATEITNEPWSLKNLQQVAWFIQR